MEKHQSGKLFRYERKYNLDLNKSEIFKKFLIEKNFHTIYKKRKVVSVYFDTLDYKFFRDNIEGVCNRIKARIRWYETLNNKKIISEPILEIKEKNGFVGSKQNFRISNFKKKKLDFKDFQLNNEISNRVYFNVFPILIVSYEREYYLNYNKKFRATVDTNLNVISLNNKKIKLKINKEIMEIKYNLEFDDDYRNQIINKNFKFRNQKFSKYVVSLLNLKKNALL